MDFTSFSNVLFQSQDLIEDTNLHLELLPYFSLCFEIITDSEEVARIEVPFTLFSLMVTSFLVAVQHQARNQTLGSEGALFCVISPGVCVTPTTV